MMDRQLIDTCKRLIEEKFDLPAGHLWKQRDFQYLADLIFEKTRTRLSISTLKRIWKSQESRSPQLYTLNILGNLLGFESWNDFKRTQRPAASDESERSPAAKPFKNRRIIYLGIPVLLVAGFLIMRHFRQSPASYKAENIKFKSRKSVSRGVPNTVIFEYDISGIHFDSAFIQHSWDERMRARVSKDNHFQTFIYYYPGYHTAKLIIDNKVVREERVNISTDGWEAIVDEEKPGSDPLYIPRSGIINNNKLYSTRETIFKDGIRNEDQKFFINYFNVGNFKGVDGDNFILETRLKNSLQDGGLVCQYVQLSIICENGMISIPFCNPGCTATIHMHISEVLRPGNKNDLTAFGIDLSSWRDITIKTVNKKVTILVDKKEVQKVIYDKALGRVTGLHYKFYGSGAVDSISIRNEKNELSYKEDFEF